MRRKFKTIGPKMVTQDDYDWRCVICGKPANKIVEKEGREFLLCAEHFANDILDKKSQK